MESMYYIGLDVHKKKISYCVKEVSGRIYAEGSIPAARDGPGPMDEDSSATVDGGDGSDHLHGLDLRSSAAAAQPLKVAHPLMLRAIAAAKKKNDRIDANKIADCLRCDFLPECYMASTEIRERRRTLRYRNLLVRQAVQLKNKIAVLLMEAGVSYNKQKLHKVGYFRELLETNQDINEGLRSLLQLCRETLVRLRKDGKRPDTVAGARSVTGRTSGSADDHSRCGADHGTDLGAGSWGREALFFDQEGHQLLRAVWRREEFGGCRSSARHFPNSATSICRRF